MSQEKPGKPSKPYLKFDKELTIRAGETLSIVPPSRSKKNQSTGEYEQLEVPEWVKNDVIKWIDE